MITVPGMIYDTSGPIVIDRFRELIPRARSFATCVGYWSRDDVEIKLPADIDDDDVCQRGPSGEPLATITPMVPFQSLAEWKGA